jgi:hypothetical protein
MANSPCSDFLSVSHDTAVLGIEQADLTWPDLCMTPTSSFPNVPWIFNDLYSVDGEEDPPQNPHCEARIVCLMPDADHDNLADAYQEQKMPVVSKANPLFTYGSFLSAPHKSSQSATLDNTDYSMTQPCSPGGRGSTKDAYVDGSHTIPHVYLTKKVD